MAKCEKEHAILASRFVFLKLFTKKFSGDAALIKKFNVIYKKTFRISCKECVKCLERASEGTEDYFLNKGLSYPSE
jgi:hypothetical protein